MRNLETTNLENLNNINGSLTKHKNINLEEIIEEKKKHLEQEIRKTIEAEFLSAQIELKQKHEEELNELFREYKYMEEVLTIEKDILKENLNKFIEENISNKLMIDDLNENLKIKDKEIEKLRNIIFSYQISQEEQREDFSASFNSNYVKFEKETNCGNNILTKIKDFSFSINF